MDNDDDYSESEEEEAESEATPGRATRHHISKSKPDYTCYTIRDGSNQVIAILVEAKLTKHSRVECAVAQVRY